MKKEIFNTIKKAFLKVAEKGLCPKNLDINFQVSIPKQKEHGDFATNLALVLAPKLKKSPREIASLFVPFLEKEPLFSKIEIAGPGFINMFIDTKIWQNVSKDIVLDPEKFYKGDIGKGQKVLVEFVSANPTGPLHIGHGRGAALGDSLARVLKAAGFDVETEYYINDVGNQMKNLGGSVYLRYKELFGEKIELPKDYYQGEYIKDIAKIAKDRWGDKYLNSSLDNCLQEFINIAVEEILSGIKKDLEDFGVKFNTWFSEKILHETGLVKETLEELQKKGEIYEKDGALWFCSSKYGDEKDRVVKKADGSLTYFASDIAYHRHKIDRGYDLLVDIWGADHHGYVARVKAAVKSLGYDPKKLNVLLVQLVNLLEQGKLKAMSTRAGQFVTLRELIDDVGKDAARFIFLTRRHDSHLDFDLDIARKKSQENPVYYVQYAHARMCSVIKMAQEKGITIEDPNNVDVTKLSQVEEIEILKHLSSFPDVIEESAKNLEPHHISYYLTDLAGLLHTYYAKHRFISDDIELTKARLLIAMAIKITIAKGLELLGVNAPEKM